MRIKPHLYKVVLIAMALLIGYIILQVIFTKASIIMYADSEWYDEDDLLSDLKWIRVITDLSVEYVFYLCLITILVYGIEFALIYVGKIVKEKLIETIKEITR